MFEMVQRLYFNKQIDLSGLDRAVNLNWITVEEKQTIIETI